MVEFEQELEEFTIPVLRILRRLKGLNHIAGDVLDSCVVFVLFLSGLLLGSPFLVDLLRLLDQLGRWREH